MDSKQVTHVILVTLLTYVVANYPQRILKTSIVGRPLPHMSRLRPHFFVCTHDFEHVDLISVAKESFRWYQQTGLWTNIIVANRMYNRLYDLFIPKFGTCVFVKENTTAKILKSLQTRNVCILLYRDNPGKGCHYVMRSFSGPCVLMRITSSDAKMVTDHSSYESVVNSVGCTYHVSYVQYESEAHAFLPPREGMLALKHSLYHFKERVGAGRTQKGVAPPHSGGS
jgi:hypothetical protein